MGQGSSSTALIFNIVNSSFVDGYGIRTTIFLKGCPLRCEWCCNPEGQSFAPELQYIPTHCGGCGRCVQACPRGAISMAGGLAAIDRALCDSCGECVKRCFFDALSIVGEQYTAERIFGKILREKPYFDASGGGLTIGGGEATCWPDFCRELTALCHGAGISVAIDTCGYMTRPDSIKVLEEADLLLFDIKGLDEEAHRRSTGVSNRPILETFSRMRDIKKPVIVRVPVIPRHNNSPEELRATADFLTGFPNVERVDLIPFHEFGRVKYGYLGRDYTMDETPLTPEEEAELRELFLSRGLNAQIGG